MYVCVVLVIVAVLTVWVYASNAHSSWYCTVVITVVTRRSLLSFCFNLTVYLATKLSIPDNGEGCAIVCLFMY